jgi:hypothetical protein
VQQLPDSVDLPPFFVEAFGGDEAHALRHD